MNRQPRIDLVCFDVGGVLIRVCTSFQEGTLTAGLPVRLSGGEMARLFDCARDARHELRTGRLRMDEFARRVSSTFNGIYTPAEISSIMTTWVGETYPETEPMLQALKQKDGLKVAVLSNTCREHWAQICTRSWMKHIDYIFTSHELGIAKPSPEIYSVVESSTGIAPERILFMDDAPENILAAKQRGWNSVQIDCSRERNAQVLGSLSAWNIDLSVGVRTF
jgi:glucose-1-phosphatase